MSNNSIILQILCAVVILIVFNDIVLPPSYAAIAASTGLRGGVSRTTHCEYYNKSVCSESRGQGGEQGCNEREECSSSNEPEKRNHCFVLWRADPTGNMTIELKGCFTNSNECFNKSECVEKAPIPKKDMLFCCCEGDMCNQNFTWDPAPTEPPKIPALADQEEEHKTTLILVGIIILISVICGIGFRFYCKNKLTLFNELPTMDALPEAQPCVGLRPIQLLEIKARGRFGAVWKAQFKTEEVAVKIFPIQDKQSWLSEQEIYKLPHMSHQDILQFIGVEKRGENLQAEFWLITAYHERGSLCDYLKANVLSWFQLCQIAESMARGLMHIHEEIPSTKLQGYKPAIAHRDFKSKNVLLKSDMSACIADFGLALIFEPGQPCGDTHGQVGTRRYMAPEVLEGAINFMRDSFLRIDMYACGLVLWELASRCSYGSTIPPEYRLPLEEEVGQHPTLEDMQEAVVQRKVRPTIKEEWRQHTGLSILCDTMEECWDHDAEARLSASCVMERVALQSRFSAAVTCQRIEPPVSSPTTPLVRDSTLNV